MKMVGGALRELGQNLTHGVTNLNIGEGEAASIVIIDEDETQRFGI